MHSILITFDQAHYERIVTMLERMSCRGFTALDNVKGRGSRTGEPHYGSHAWPSMNSAIITVVDDSRLRSVMDALRAMDEEAPRLGLRAFAWPVTETI
ncbi:MAG: hypothetical protein HDS11_06190 [Bacteroides sp.]|nr:hypothetical protein [Bacteroides sp.]MBD5377404.1 hypothetical protein [Bacteroides sp.]